jgi:hypothetical protein
MDLAKMIAELQDEKFRLDEAIEALERLTGQVSTRRRGRPAKSADIEVPDSEEGTDSLEAEPLRSKKAAGDHA